MQSGGDKEKCNFCRQDLSSVCAFIEAVTELDMRLQGTPQQHQGDQNNYCEALCITTQ